MSTRPIGALIGRKLDELDRRYAAYLAGGFPLADYPGEAIHCRSDHDRTNWFELRDSCRVMFEAGQGDALIPEPGIRCVSNRYIRPTIAETLNILEWLKAYVWIAQGNWWRLKDAARAVSDWRELERLDLDEGWP